MKLVRRWLVLLAAVLSIVPDALAGERPTWSDRATELAGGLPIQDAGRIKPLSTYARFTLLRLSGRKSAVLADGTKRGATPWLFDVLIAPGSVRDEPLFLVQDSEAVEALGIAVDGHKKRDRWSANELAPGEAKLFNLAHEYDAIDPKRRTSLQQQVVTLAENLHAFQSLVTAFDWARTDIAVDPGSRVAEVLGGATNVRFSAAIERAAALATLHTELTSATDSAARSELEALYRFEQALADAARGSRTLRLVPPAVSASECEEWLTPYAALSDAFAAGDANADVVRSLRAWEGLARAERAPEEVLQELTALHTQRMGLRAEGGELALEVAYYRWNPLAWSQGFFGLAFLSAAVLWMRPRWKTPYALACGLVGVATSLLVAAIVMRCVIRGRPPVSTLYETVLFVTATGCLLALAVEFVNKKRVAVSTAAVLGLVGLFLANGYETLDKQDTMPNLVAVLDTNFWLATHVTSITIGYSAGLLAALLANVYLLAKLVGWKRSDPGFFREVARMVYGVTCFAAIFAIVGTILGGIWANESWGRFWGWDPKENGALLIVIGQVAFLHGRMSGLLREHGLCVAAAFSGTIIAFSWWGVNLLGVGLHSYGFTSGIQTALWSYYLAQWALCVAGIAIAWRSRRGARPVLS